MPRGTMMKFSVVVLLVPAALFAMGAGMYAGYSALYPSPEKERREGSVLVSIPPKSKKPQCEPLRTACDRAKRWFDCAQNNLGNMLGLVGQTKAEAQAEKATREAQLPPGVPNPESPGYLQLDAALNRLMNELLRMQTNLVTTQAMTAADCALLPGPEDQKECQEAAERVNEATQKSQEELKTTLDREFMILEASIAGVPGSAARAKLLAQMRMYMTLLDTCKM